MRSVRLVSAREARVLPAGVQLSVFQRDLGGTRVLLCSLLLTSPRTSTQPHSFLLPPTGLWSSGQLQGSLIKKLHTLTRELHAMGQERSILSLMYAFYCNFYVPGTVLSFLRVFLTSIIYHISTAKETKAERRGVACPRSWREFLCRSAIYIQVCLLRCLCWKPLCL